MKEILHLLCTFRSKLYIKQITGYSSTPGNRLAYKETTLLLPFPNVHLLVTDYKSCLISKSRNTWQNHCESQKNINKLQAMKHVTDLRVPSLRYNRNGESSFVIWGVNTNTYYTKLFLPYFYREPQSILSPSCQLQVILVI